jgi:hypothetical protein
MPVGELYEATDLLAWLASGKWPYDRPDYLYRWRDPFVEIQYGDC